MPSFSSHKRSRQARDQRSAKLLCARPQRFENENQVHGANTLCVSTTYPSLKVQCNVQDVDHQNQVQSAFMRMDVNGDGTLTKREMLAAEEFTPEEVTMMVLMMRVIDDDV